MPGAGNPQTFNRYSYVNNSPTNFIDPSGHVFEMPNSSTCSLLDENCASSEEISELRNFTEEYDCAHVVNGICVDEDGYYVQNPVNDADAEVYVETITFFGRFWEPIDYYQTGKECLQGDCSWLSIALMLLPFVPGHAGKYIDGVYNGAVKNPNALFAVIGHWEDGVSSYNRVASSRGATHLFSDKFTEFVDRYGYQAWMDNINTPFIQREIIDEGLDVMLSTPLAEIQTAGRAALDEVNLLLEAGYTHVNGWLFAP